MAEGGKEGLKLNTFTPSSRGVKGKTRRNLSPSLSGGDQFQVIGFSVSPFGMLTKKRENIQVGSRSVKLKKHNKAVHSPQTSCELNFPEYKKHFDSLQINFSF